MLAYGILIMLFLRSVLFLLFQAVTVVPYALGCVLVLPLPFIWRYRYTAGWPRMVIWAAKVLVGIRYEVKGEHYIPDAPAIYLSKQIGRASCRERVDCAVVRAPVDQ